MGLLEFKRSVWLSVAPFLLPAWLQSDLVHITAFTVQQLGTGLLGQPLTSLSRSLQLAMPAATSLQRER